MGATLPPEAQTRALGRYGRCLVGLGRFEAAEAVLLEAHAILTDSVGEDDARTRQIGRELADLYEQWNQQPLRSR